MKTQNLSEAVSHYSKFLVALRDAHTDAVQSDNLFAAMAVFGLLVPAHELGNKLTHISELARSQPVETVNQELRESLVALSPIWDNDKNPSYAVEIEAARAAIARAEKEGV